MSNEVLIDCKFFIFLLFFFPDFLFPFSAFFVVFSFFDFSLFLLFFGMKNQTKEYGRR